MLLYHFLFIKTVSVKKKIYNGFKVQHHAMEFKETYMCGIGKHFERGDVHLKYVYQKASEIPIHNDNVKVQNIILQIGYHF